MRDRLGEVFKAIVMTACVICGIGAVFSVFGASPNIKAEDWIRGGIFLALCIGCLFAFWLVSTLSKIAVKMSETEAHLKDAVILLSNISKKLNPPKTPAKNTTKQTESPEVAAAPPVAAETSEQ